MVKSHKSQHWIPRSYLAAWTDPDLPQGHEPYVHVYSKDGNTVRRKAPSNIFTETELYTISLPDGGRDLRLENGLSQLEGNFVAIRKDFLAPRRKLPTVRFAKLMAFTAAMLVRTPVMRDHHAQFWGGVRDQMEELENRMGGASQKQGQATKSMLPEHPEGSEKNSLSLDQVRALADDTMTHILPAFFEAQVPALLKMRSTIFCTDNDPGFITSDAPVVWFDPEWHMKPPMLRSPALSDPKLQITLPISPDQMLLITRGEPRIDYVDANEAIVAEINSRTRFYCDQEFVVRRKHLEPSWFDPGEEPEDSWEKTHGKSDVD